MIMRKHDDRAHLNYMLEMIAPIERKMSEERAQQCFLEDMFFRFGVTHALQTMTESTQKLSAEIKQRMPEIPWQKISDFRNILVHDYMGDIDPPTVLRIIDMHMPPLKVAITRVIKELYA